MGNMLKIGNKWVVIMMKEILMMAKDNNDRNDNHDNNKTDNESIEIGALNYSPQIIVIINKQSYGEKPEYRPSRGECTGQRCRLSLLSPRVSSSASPRGGPRRTASAERQTRSLFQNEESSEKRQRLHELPDP